MAQAFNLTAQLNLRGPNNVGKIVSQIKKQLGTINANVNVTINPATIQTVTQLNSALTTLNTTLATTSANATTTAAAVNSLMQAMNAAANSNINPSLNNASNAVQQLGANANAAAGGGAGGGGGGGVTQLRTEMEEFGRQSALAVRRFAAFSLVTSTVFALTNAFNQAFKAFIDFDKEFVKLQQVTGESAARLQNLAGTITELSTSLGVSSSQLAVVSSTLAQAGLSAKDTERALKALALSSLAPSFDDMNQTVEGSIALMRQFGISADQLGAALGSVNAVSAQFAVESSDIIAAIQRTGGVFASASKGVSEGTQALNEFIAVFTSFRATTRESSETIATGLRTIFTRIQRGSTIEALKEFGVTLTDAEGKFVGAYKAVELLSRGLNGIDPRDLKFSQIIEELGGFRQIGKVIPLIQQFGTAQQALAIAQGGQTSLTEDAIVAQLSLANQFAKVREEFVAMVREIGGTDTFQTLAKGALQLASALIQIADSVKGVLPVLAVITAVRGAGALRQFGRGFVGGMRGGQQNAATGGMIRKYAVGGQVPVALMPGETVVYPNMVNKI
jgi:TP901 family phage tail tape measure protein